MNSEKNCSISSLLWLNLFTIYNIIGTFPTWWMRSYNVKTFAVYTYWNLSKGRCAHLLYCWQELGKYMLHYEGYIKASYLHWDLGHEWEVSIVSKWSSVVQPLSTDFAFHWFPHHGCSIECFTIPACQECWPAPLTLHGFDWILWTTIQVCLQTLHNGQTLLCFVDGAWGWPTLMILCRNMYF